MNQTEEKVDPADDDKRKQAQLVSYWLDQIKQARKEEESWRNRGRKIKDRYRDKRGGNDNNSRFNILASNTQILHAALYTDQPKAVCRSRRAVDDPDARNAADIVENALEFSMEDYDFDGVIEAALLDGLLPGRGLSRVRYLGHEAPTTQPTPIHELDGDQEAEAVELDPETGQMMAHMPTSQIVYEEAFCEYVPWEDVTFIGGERFETLTAVVFRGLYSRAELIELAGEEIGNAIKLTVTEDGEKPRVGEDTKPKKSYVYEIWDKEDKQRLYISDGYKEAPLKVEPDPLGLKGFYPCPKPMRFIFTNDTMEPVPLFIQYQDQANELDELSRRIQRLVKKLQAKGLYNGAIKELAALNSEKDSSYIPVQASTDIDLNKAIAHWPIDQIAKVLLSLYQQRDSLKQQIYEITGISDIVRGASAPSETATAQRLKGQFASVRLEDMKNEVKRFVRDILALKGEIIATRFSPETLSAITGIDVSPSVASILQATLPRRYRIEVETSDTAEPDINEDRQRSMDLVQGVAQIAPLAMQIDSYFGSGFTKELVAITIRKFHAGKQIDDIIDKSLAIAATTPMMPGAPQGMPQPMGAPAGLPPAGPPLPAPIPAH